MKRIILLILFFYSYTTFSQKLIYTGLSIQDGLPSSHITQILQDDEDYLWIATNNGINRFNGYDVIYFNKTNKLPENQIVRIIKDDKGLVWFLGESGSLSYYSNSTIKKYPFNNVIYSLIANRGFVETSSIQIKNNEVEFNIYEKGRFKIDSLGMLSVIYDLSGNINTIDLTGDKLSYFLSKNNKTLELIEEEKSYLFKNINLEGKEPILIERIEETVYFANQNKLYYIKSGKLDSLIFDYNILSLQKDNSDLWIGFIDDGAYCYKNSNLEAKPFLKEFHGESISSVYRDRNNSLWFSSLSNGLFFVPSDIYKKVTDKEGLIGHNVRNLTRSNNSVWVVTDSRSITEIKNTEIRNFNNLDYSAITDILWKDGRLWLSFKDKLCYLKGGFPVEVVKLNNRIQKYSRINAINLGRHNTIWLCKTDGFAKLKNNRIVFESADKGLEALNVNKIIEEKDGVLWLACKSGLWKYMNNKLIKYKPENNLLSENISDFVIDDSGSLWLTINGKGLVNIKKGSILNIRYKDGLVSDNVSSIYKYGDYIWIGSSHGISRVKIHTSNNKLDILNINRQAGLLSNEVKDIILDKDYVYASTNKGICYFKHSNIEPNPLAPKLYAYEIVAGEEKKGSNTKSISLDYQSNSFKVKYFAIHFKSQGRVHYRYKMLGLDKEWTYGYNTEANYPFIPPGKYTFQISASNENNIWSESLELEIIIGNPFWLQWWFFVLAFLLISFISYFIYRIIERTSKKKEKVQLEINEYRQMALSRQMNPHFIFNSLNSIQHYILQNDILLSSRFLSKFSKLIRIILENSQEPLISLEEEISSIRLYMELEALRFKERMKYTIDVDTKIDLMNTEIPPMLIQPFLENAIWHGLMNITDKTQGVLNICFTETENGVVCKVRDNGIGREKSREINQQKNTTHISLGTSITQDRIDLINKIHKMKIDVVYEDLKDSEKNAIGTIVNIILAKGNPKNISL